MENNKKEILITLTGPSGSGKSFLAGLLKKQGFQESISTTTREKRAGEKDGESYHFINREEFEKRINLKQFIEVVEVNNNMYGIENTNLVKQKGIPAVIVVEPHGLDYIQKYAKENNIEVMSIFINSPKDVLFERLFSRFKDEIINIYKSNKYDNDNIKGKLFNSQQTINSKKMADEVINSLIKETAKLYIENNVGTLTILNYLKNNILSSYGIEEYPTFKKDELYKKTVITTISRLDHIEQIEFPEWVKEAQNNKSKYHLNIKQFNENNTTEILNLILNKVEKLKLSFVDDNNKKNKIRFNN